jgi:hypothetical protein
MKKIFLGLIGMIGLLGLGGCDRIEEGEYTVYDGAVISWLPTEATIPAVQRVYVEKYTGPKCSNCPLADQTLSTIHNDNVVVVSINHPTGQGIPFPDEPDMRTEGGNTWDKYFKINAIPAAYINRDKSTLYAGSMSNIIGDIESALAKTPVVALKAEATQASDKVQVNAYLEFLQDYPQPVTLTAALIEDSLEYKQLLPDGTIDEDYAHNHMLRKVITGFWGSEVNAKGVKNEKVNGALSFTPDASVKLENSHIVVFISDKKTRRVLNCAECVIN